MPGLLDHAERTGITFVISAPAGTGKTTLVHKLTQEFPSIIPSISYTTRAPRQDEIQGVHYHFITEPEFEAKIALGDFLEYVQLYGTYYGTSRNWLQQQHHKGQHVILVIDTQGALQIKSLCRSVLIFICPPSLEALRSRLTHRQTEGTAAIEQRLSIATLELAALPHYDYRVVNDDLETAYQVLRSIFIAECHRIGAKT